MDATAVSSRRLGQPIVVSGIVLDGEEDGAAIVAALDDVQRLISEGKLYIFGKPAPMGPALFQQDLAANIAKANKNRALIQRH